MAIDQRLFSLLMRRPGTGLLLILAAAVACIPLIRPQFDNTLEGWIDVDSAEYRDYRHLVETFGDDQNVVAVFRRDDLTPDKTVRYLVRLEEIRTMPGVSGIFDPLQLFLGASELEGVDEVLVEDIRRFMATHPADFRNMLISKDAEHLGLLVLFERGQAALHPRLLAAIEDTFGELNIPVRLGGTVYFSEALNGALPRDLAVVIGLLVAVALAALVFYLRSLRLAAGVFLGIVFSLVFTLAFAGWLGAGITLLSLIVFPLVFCVGVTTAIHLFSRRSGGVWNPEDAYRKIRKPAFMAMLTTAAGCASFAFAPQPVVAKMGLLLPAAVVFSFVCALYPVPAAFRLFSKEGALPPLRHRKAGRSGRVRVAVAWLLLASAAAAAGVAGRIETNPDAYYFFKKDSEFVASYEFIENTLTGLLAVEMVLKSVDGRTLTDSPHRDDIAALQGKLRGLEGLTGTVSVFDTLAFLPADALPDDFKGGMLSRSGAEARLTLRYKNSGGFDYRQAVGRIRDIWSNTNHPGLSMTLTGLVPLMLEAQDALLKVQSQVFVAGLTILTVLIAALFRSLRIMIAAVAANFIPLLITAGVMAWLEIPVNSINLFVASVMLGVIVDDTIHLLYAYRETGGIEQALTEVQAALWITTMTVLLAFATLMVSAFVPVVQFGLLSAVAIASAYLCDVYLLPYLMTGASRSYEPTTV